MSEETKEKLRISRTGKKASSETRKKMSIRVKGEGNPFYGKSHTEETILTITEKCREASSGANNPMAKRVYCDGVVYECANDCADFYGIRRQTLHAYLNGNIRMPHKFIKMELRYIDYDIKYEKQLENKYATKGNSKKVICDNVVYGSIKECAEHYGFNKETFRRWLSGEQKMQERFVMLGLDFYDKDQECVS